MNILKISDRRFNITKRVELELSNYDTIVVSPMSLSLSYIPAYKLKFNK